MSRVLLVDDEPRILLLLQSLLKTNGYEIETARDGASALAIVNKGGISRVLPVEDMLSSVADSYDEEVEMMLATLTALMEPILMVFLGVVIGTIVAAMFMPIFNMGSLAS